MKKSLTTEQQDSYFNQLYLQISMSLSPESYSPAFTQSQPKLPEAELRQLIASKPTDASGQTLLNNAIDIGQVDVALKLIELGADVNAKGKFGIAPLDAVDIYEQGQNISFSLDVPSSPADMIRQSLLEKGAVATPSQAAGMASGTKVGGNTSRTV